MRNEVDLVNKLYPRFIFSHEGHSVILEEVDELWDLVRANLADQ